MTSTKSLFISVFGAFLVLCLLGSFITSARASAPSGVPATVATTSNIVVSTSAGTAFASSTCSARLISTASSSVMITFSDYKGDVPTASFGFVQAASTSVSYDSGLWGCGRVRIYSFAPQVITVMETN